MAVPVVFSTGSLYPFGLERVFGWAAQVGFDGVEVMMDERWDTHQSDYLNGLSEKYGVRIQALHPPIGRGAWGLGAEETLVRSVRLARKIGAETVVAHPPSLGRPLSRWREGTLAEARNQGVTVAVENMPRGEARRFFIVRNRRVCEPEDLAGLGDVTLDTSHLGASGLDPMRAWDTLKERLRHVHLSDSNYIPGRDEHRLPGKGKLPLKELLAAIGGSEYTGVVSLELKPWPLGTPHPEKILSNMSAALEFTREGLGHATSSL